MTAFSFNAATVAPSTGPEAIPAGWYHAKIVETEIKPTSGGDGLRMSLQFEIIGGQYNGRKIFTGLNIKNANAQAQEIAYKDLSAIQHAIGRIEITNTDQLCGVPLNIKVKVRGERKDPTTGETYEATNDITTYKAYDANIPQAGGAAPGAVTGAPILPSGFGAAASAPIAAPPGFGAAATAPAAAPAAAQANPVPWQQPPAAQPWQDSPAAQPPGAVASAPVAAAPQVAPPAAQPDVAAMMAQMAAMQAQLAAAQAAAVVAAPAQVVQAPVAAPAPAATTIAVENAGGQVPPWAMTPPAQ